MSPDAIGRAGDVFFDLLELDEGARGAALEAACAGDVALRAQVEALLRNHFRAERFMETSPVRSGMLGQTPTLSPGTRVAGYTVLGVLGSGGMGVVYVAEQQRPRRTVALKVIRGGGGSLPRRFELEAEALGRLQHPGIAHIFEAGTAEVEGHGSLPFIAMELVNGLPLTRDAEARGLGVRERVDVLRRVCEAVEHAHQRGIIHRDLKPANILVAGGDPPRPKVLDFGVARAVGEGAQGVTAHTDVGQLIGTLAYMSPEQVRAHPAEVDTRSDVYALGVILFELLTGRTPHDLKDLPLPEAARVICETPAPRLSTVYRALRGDLETITAKALDKDKERRYRSAADLGDDLRRYLEGQPIAARDDSALYILRKQIRRYRGTVAVGALSVLALAATAIYALQQSARNARLAASESQAKTQALNAVTVASTARERAFEAAARLRAELAVSNIERGRLFGRTGNLRAAEELLWPEYIRDPDSRQAHWALWDLYSRQPCLGTVQAHSGPVLGMAMAPDDTLYTGGADGAINIWDAATMLKRGTLSGHVGAILDVQLSRDGKRLASASADGTVRLWDLGSGGEPAVIVHAPVEAVEGPTRPVAAHTASFSPDGRRIATGGDDGVVRVWDARTGALLATMGERFKAPVSRVVWSPEGTSLAASAIYPDTSMRLWDAVAGSPSALLPGHEPAISSIAFSPDGRTIASGGSDREIHLIDVATRQVRRKLLAPNGTVRCVEFTADGHRLMSTGWWTLDLWDLDKEERTRSLSLREGANVGVMRPDGNLVAAGCADGTVQSWDLEPDAGMVRLKGQEGRTTAAMSPDAKMLATGDGAGVVRFWDMREGVALASLKAHEARVRSLKFSPDGRLLATSGDDDRVRLWDVATGERLAEMTGTTATTCDSIAFDPTGRTLAVPVDDNSIVLASVPDLHEQGRTGRTRGQIVSVAYTPDGRTVAAASRDLGIYLMPTDGGRARQLKPPGPPWTLAFAPDGTRMVTGSWNKSVEVWDMPSGAIQTTLRGHSALISAVTFFPGKPDVVASSATDGTVRLWDARSGLALATLEAFGGWDALSVSVSPDGQRIAAGSAQGEAVIWDAAYFDRHIAGNAEYQLTRLLPDLGEAAKPDKVRARAAGVLSRAHERWSPPQGLPGIDPAAVAAWGARKNKGAAGS